MIREAQQRNEINVQQIKAGRYLTESCLPFLHSTRWFHTYDYNKGKVVSLSENWEISKSEWS